MKSALRVAIVTESFLPDINGVTNSVLRVLDFLRENGHEAIVIAPESANCVNQYRGFKVKRTTSLRINQLLPVGMPERMISPLIEGFNPDVIHLASPLFLGNYVNNIAKKLGIPTVSIYQTDLAGFASRYKLAIAHKTLRKWVSNIHSQTDRTLVPSTWSLNELEEAGVKNARIWQRGIDLDKFNPVHRNEILRHQLGGARKKLVGYVGRLAPEKGLEDLRALNNRKDIQLVIVGDGPSREKYVKYLNNAIFLGFKEKEELSQIYASLDLFVHTGRYETFCQSVQEALSSGVPVIAPNSGGPIDLITHLVSGYLIDVQNVSTLNYAIDHYLHDSDQKNMAEIARTSVLGRSWNVINNQLLTHYRDVLASKNRQAGAA